MSQDAAICANFIVQMITAIQAGATTPPSPSVPMEAFAAARQVSINQTIAAPKGKANGS